MAINVGDGLLPPNEASFVIEIRPKQGGQLGMLSAQLFYGRNGLLWINEEYKIDIPGGDVITVRPSDNARRSIYIDLLSPTSKYHYRRDDSTPLSITLADVKLNYAERDDQTWDLLQDIVQFDETLREYQNSIEEDEYGPKIRLSVHIKDSGDWNYPPGYEHGVFCNPGMLTRDDLYWYGPGGEDHPDGEGRITGPGDYPENYRAGLRDSQKYYQEDKPTLAYFVNILPQSRLEHCINLGDVINDGLEKVIGSEINPDLYPNPYLALSYIGQRNAITIGYVDVINWSMLDQVCHLPIPYTDEEWRDKQYTFGWRMPIPGTSLVFRVLDMHNVRKFNLSIDRPKYYWQSGVETLDHLWRDVESGDKLKLQPGKLLPAEGLDRSQLYRVFQGRPPFISKFKTIVRTSMMTLVSELDHQRIRSINDISLRSAKWTYSQPPDEDSIYWPTRTVLNYRECYDVRWLGGKSDYLDRINHNREVYRQSHPNESYPEDGRTIEGTYASGGCLWMMVPAGQEERYKWLFDDFHETTEKTLGHGTYGRSWYRFDRRNEIIDR